MVIDVSSWQGSISWPAVKSAGVQLAIIKATEGVGFEDPRFAENWAGAKAANVSRGAYHFARPDTGNSALAEANFFLATVRAHGLDPTDLLAEDYEVAGGGAAWSLAWLAFVSAETKTVAPFYSNYSGCARVNDPRMAAYPLWLAYPGDGIHVPQPPAPWKAIRLWQYATGTVAGIGGLVDEDVNLGLFAAGSGILTREDDMPYLFHDVNGGGIWLVGEGGKRLATNEEWSLYNAAGIVPHDAPGSFLATIPDAATRASVPADLAPIAARLDSLKAQIAALPAGTVDISPLEQAIAAVKTELDSVKAGQAPVDLSALEQAVAALQLPIAAIKAKTDRDLV